MSHFSVLVVGDDPEALLAPFDESIQVEPYEDEELDPQTAVNWAKKALTDPEVISRRTGWTPEDEERYTRITTLNVSNEAQAREALAWYGYEDVVRKPDGRYVRLTQYNPESKWDYYRLGGRWRGSLKLKDTALVSAAATGSAELGELGYEFRSDFNNGKQHVDETGWVDTCLRGDLDLAGMLEVKRLKGVRAVANLIDFISEMGNPPSLEWSDWGFKDPRWQDAKDAFWKSPWVKEFNKRAWAARDEKESVIGLGLGMGGWWEFDDFRLVTENADGRDRFLMLQEARGIPGFAFLDAEHGWMEAGKMGWFGMSDDTPQSRIGFYEARMAIVGSLPDDARLSVFDCHI